MTAFVGRAAARDAGPSVEGWARRLSVRARARADGLAGVPAPEDRALSATERDILATLSASAQQALAERDQAAAALAASLRRLRPAVQAGPDWLATGRSAIRQAEGRLTRDMGRAHARAATAAADLAAFKRRHGLERPAVYPASVLMQVAVLAVMALAEGAFSAALFATDDQMGLVGGAVKALGLGAANVALGVCAGYFGLRQAQSRFLAPRLLGGALFAGLAAVTVLLNVFAALWRQDLARIGRELSAGDISRMPHFVSIFDVTLWSPEAVILLIIGGAVWVIATLKGFRGLDDPYPGYGQMDRHARDAEEEADALRADARAALEAPLEEARTAAAAEAAADAKTLAALTAAFDGGAEPVAAADARRRDAKRAAAALVALYRQENLAARRTPPPAGFAAPPELVAEPEGDALAEAGAVLTAAQSEAAARRTAAAEALEALSAELEAATARLDAAGAP